jgi:hypothetical protein
MAVRYDGTSDLWVRSGGVWVHENSGTANLYVTTGGGFGFQVAEVYRKIGGGWVRVLHTDKFAPNAAPTGVTITSILGGGGTRQARINWTEATGMPLSATSYDLYIYYYNNTDPTKNQSTVVGAGRLGTQFTFPNAGFSGDADCYADLSYQEVGVGGFSGPVASTSHITL